MIVAEATIHIITRLYQNSLTEKFFDPFEIDNSLVDNSLRYDDMFATYDSQSNYYTYEYSLNFVDPLSISNLYTISNNEIGFVDNLNQNQVIQSFIYQLFGSGYIDILSPSLVEKTTFAFMSDMKNRINVMIKKGSIQQSQVNSIKNLYDESFASPYFKWGIRLLPERLPILIQLSMDILSYTTVYYSSYGDALYDFAISQLQWVNTQTPLLIPL